MISNQTWTRFSHEPLAGVKWMWMRGWSASQLSRWGFVGGVVVHDQVQLDVGVGAGQVLEKTRNSWWRCCCVHSPVTFAVATSRAANRVAVPWRT